jgi:hypothetical protein
MAFFDKQRSATQAAIETLTGKYLSCMFFVGLMLLSRKMRAE